MVLGERLKKLREEKKYSQEDLAELLNVHNNTVSKWENGTQEPRAKRINEIAKILCTTSAYLLGDTDNKNSIEQPAQRENPLNELSDNERNSKILHQSSKSEKSINNGMLVYVTKSGDRFEAPPTELGIKYLEKMFAMGITPQRTIKNSR